MGSPPHMRGTQIYLWQDYRMARITPAHAGNTNGEHVGAGRAGDHPRTCGEHSILSNLRLCRFGSPPHMRGTHISSAEFQLCYRITPAHAGNTGIFSTRQNRSQDHPRTCGEHMRQAPVRLWDTGSPPHMRGTHCGMRGRMFEVRITPAHAGNTRWRSG